MIALKKTTRHECPSESWQEQFTSLLPAIREEAAKAFRHMRPEAREDALGEVAASACCAYARLVELGKTDIAYPRALARFGIKRFYDGRRVGSRMNVKDATSPYARRRSKIIVKSLDRFDNEENAWREAVVEDDQTPIPDQVAFRIDFPSWLKSYPKRERRIAVAELPFPIAPARIVEIRVLPVSIIIAGGTKHQGAR